MNRLPAVSVVLSVYQEPELVRRTMLSVLRQTGIDLEFIVVCDGAQFSVLEVVRSLQSDRRIVVLEQDNQGLTKALIRGCEAATTPFIARIDAGDVMHESRLSEQAKVLLADEKTGLVCSPVDMYTEEGFFLYHVDYNRQALERGLTTLDVRDVKNPFHASVMFRKDSYKKVGGYRAEFYFAQDCDLWSRMIECSGIQVMSEPYTDGVFLPGSLSGRYRKQQAELTRIILKLRHLRAAEASEVHCLQQAGLIRPIMAGVALNRNEYPGLYFIAKCLMDQNSKQSVCYFKRAIRAKPYSVKAWFYYLKVLLFKISVELNRKQ